MVVAGIFGSLGFSLKKAIASSKVAVQIRINPIRGIIAPISSSVPAVVNNPTFDFSERSPARSESKNPGASSEVGTRCPRGGTPRDRRNGNGGTAAHRPLAHQEGGCSIDEGSL